LRRGQGTLVRPGLAADPDLGRTHRLGPTAALSGPAVRRLGQPSSVASRVIGVAFSAADTGHPSLAPSAIRAKSSAKRPGTEATVVRWMPVMPVPATKVTSAVVRTDSGVVPFEASSLDSAIE